MVACQLSARIVLTGVVAWFCLGEVTLTIGNNCQTGLCATISGKKGVPFRTGALRCCFMKINVSRYITKP